MLKQVSHDLAPSQQSHLHDRSPERAPGTRSSAATAPRGELSIRAVARRLAGLPVSEGHAATAYAHPRHGLCPAHPRCASQLTTGDTPPLDFPPSRHRRTGSPTPPPLRSTRTRSRPDQAPTGDTSVSPRPLYDRSGAPNCVACPSVVSTTAARLLYAPTEVTPSIEPFRWFAPCGRERGGSVNSRHACRGVGGICLPTC